jgi:hypothetical protein
MNLLKSIWALLHEGCPDAHIRPTTEIPLSLIAAIIIFSLDNRGRHFLISPGNL